MDEWTVVTSLSVLAALAAAVAGPLVRLNGTSSRLSAMLEHVLARLDKLEGEDEKLRCRGEQSQRELGRRIEDQGQRLNRCENRLSLLEQTKGENHGH